MKNYFALLKLLVVLPLGGSALFSSALTGSFHVGTDKQLFLDHQFIESSEGIALSMHAPYQTGEKLIVADQPWEKACIIGGASSVLREEGPKGIRTRLWYDVFDIAEQGVPGKGFRAIGYAESADGIHFEKPILGLVELKGSMSNNLVMPTDASRTAVGGGSVSRDENPNCPPDQRYKSWSKFYSTPGSLKGDNRIWHSPDGFRWKIASVAPTGLRKADTQPSWLWDSRIGRYLGYSREWVDLGRRQRVRMVGYNESDDMLKWDSFELALKPDEQDGVVAPVVRVLGGAQAVEGKDTTEDVSPASSAMDFYAPGIFKYREAPNLYFAMLSAFYHWQNEGGVSFPDTGDVQLAFSRDGRNFQRLGARQPFLRLGPEGTFWSKYVWPLVQPVRMGNELWIYYQGTNQDHSLRLDKKASQPETAISRAILRLDGFVSVDAAYSGGWLTTPPLVHNGSRLELNLDTSAGGTAQVEVRDIAGKSIAGYRLADADAMNGNSVSMNVSWKGKSDVSSFAGKPFRLHFKLKNCRLYAFQFL